MESGVPRKEEADCHRVVSLELSSPMVKGLMEMTDRQLTGDGLLVLA